MFTNQINSTGGKAFPIGMTIKLLIEIVTHNFVYLLSFGL